MRFSGASGLHEEAFQDTDSPFSHTAGGAPGVKYFSDCEMHCTNSNPTGMAGAGIKATSTACEHCSAGQL